MRRPDIEYLNGELSYQLKSGIAPTVHTAALRVWRKEDGLWKIAAFFMRPMVE